MEAMRVSRVQNLRVTESAEANAGIACTLEFVFSDGAVSFCLDVEGLRYLRDALVMAPPPTPRTLGQN